MMQMGQRFWQALAYQLGFLVIGVLLGAPAIIATTLTPRLSAPAVATAIVGFAVAHTTFVLRDLDDSELESFTDYETRLSLAETALLFALTALYISAVLTWTAGLGVALASTMSGAAIAVPLFAPFLDALCFRRLGISPGAAPMIAMLWLIHVAGRARRLDPSMVRRYGQRPRY